MPRVLPKVDGPEPEEAGMSEAAMESQVDFSAESLGAMKQIELRELCKKHGVSTSGAKVDLAKRLSDLKLDTADASAESPSQERSHAEGPPNVSVAETLPNAGAVEAPHASAAELVQEEPPAKRPRGRPPKGTREESAAAPTPLATEESDMAMTKSQEGHVAASPTPLTSKTDTSPLNKTPAWQRFRVASRAESAQILTRVPPGAKRPAATTVPSTELEPFQSLPEAKTPASTETQRAALSPHKESSAVMTPVVMASGSASVSDAAPAVEAESPKTPAKTTARTPLGLMRHFQTAAHNSEPTLASASSEQGPAASAAPKIEEKFVDFYAEVRNLFRLPKHGSPDAFDELGRTARQLLETLRAGDAGELRAKRARMSEADRALEHVLEVVSSGAAPAEGSSAIPSNHQAEEPPEASRAQAPVTVSIGDDEIRTVSRRKGDSHREQAEGRFAPSSCWRSNGDLRWARVELEQALVSVSVESDEIRTVSREAVESWLGTPAADRIRAFHLDEGCRRTAELIMDDKCPSLEYFIERALYEANIVYAPFSAFRNAEEDEIQDMPKICTAFGAFLVENQAIVNESTVKTYVDNFKRVFKFDGKAPAEMATMAYIDRVRHTFEDAVHNHVCSGCLSKFAIFWQNFGTRPFKSDIAGDCLQLVPSSLPRRQPEEGDGSESARRADLMPATWRSDIGNLPEGWRSHTTTKGRTLTWTSPKGEWHMKKGELVRRLVGQPPPPLFYVPPPVVYALPVPPPVSTPEKHMRPEKEKAVYPPLAELLHPLPKPGEPWAAEERDRKLLPQVVQTFARIGSGRMEHRELTRKAHAVTIFKLVSDSQRSFEALADPNFVEMISKCAENKKTHGSYGSALRSFREFWLYIGGYEGEYDIADRDNMEKSLYVKPCLVDASGECGYGGISSDFCRWPKRWCETCGTSLRCGKHEEHSREMCREVFWSKHRADGTPLRTIADFFGTKAAKKATLEATSGAEPAATN